MISIVSILNIILSSLLLQYQPVWCIRRMSEPIESNGLDGNVDGNMFVPPELVGATALTQTDIPGRPLDPSDFIRADEMLTPGKSPKIDGDDPILAAKLFQGDIVIPDFDALEFINSHSVDKKFPFITKNVIGNLNNRWPGANIPYSISSQFNNGERAVIARAMDAFHKATCVRFVPRSGQNDHVHITKGNGCSSAVGRVGGQQTVSLGNGCVHEGIVIHELMHSAGFWHEQSRADRDNHIKIVWNNIQNGLAYNFDKYEWGYIQNLSVSYDTGSIMHYGAYAFSVDRSQPTIISLDGGTLGQREGFSQRDIQKLNLLYQCNGGVTTTPAPVTTTTQGSVCKNSNRYCKIWGELGECERNPNWMHVNCKQACNKCGTEMTCKNDNINCEKWKKEGHCVISEFYMKHYCRYSCGLCTDNGGSASCEDKNKYCKAWGRLGECKKNPDWMMMNCKKSCNNC